MIVDDDNYRSLAKDGVKVAHMARYFVVWVEAGDSKYFLFGETTFEDVSKWLDKL